MLLLVIVCVIIGVLTHLIQSVEQGESLVKGIHIHTRATFQQARETPSERENPRERERATFFYKAKK